LCAAPKVNGAETLTVSYGSEALERASLMIRDKTWVQSTTFVNGENKGLIAEHGRPRSPTPEVPPLRPAALEPVWSRGRLTQLPKSTESDSEPIIVLTALELLRVDIASLADDAERDGNIDHRSIACLRSVAGRIPGHIPGQVELFYLAHVKESLEAHAKVVNDEWPAFLAKRFDEVTLDFDRAVRRFPKWRDFVTNAEKDRLTAEQAANVSALANMMVAALREDEARNLIDPAIPSVLEVFQAPIQNYIQQALGPIEAGKLVLANDLLESINNIAKRTAEAALEIRNFGPPNEKSDILNEEFSSREKDGRQVYIWMTRTLLGLMTDAPTLTLNSRFCWLKSIISLFGPQS
jgi:hypothetical protein